MTEHWFVTRPEAAGFLGVSLSTLSRWIAAGYLRIVDTELGKLLPLGELSQFKREREAWGALLTGRQVGELLGMTGSAVAKHARKGELRRQFWGTLIRYRRQDVVDYWREHMAGACLRCGILGEAEPERGFMCEACEYEARTGRTYRFPIVPRCVARGVLRGTLSRSKQI